MFAPAVLISASALFVLSTAQRLSRQLERVRRAADARQLEFATRRARLLQGSLAAQYAASCLFIATIFAIAWAGARGAGQSRAALALALGGAGALFYASVLLLLESRQAFDAVRQETRAALSGRAGAPDANGP